MNKKRVLLIGGSGQLGSDILELFTPVHELVAPAPEELDLLDYKNLLPVLESFLKIDLVINCAAMTNTALCEEKVDEAYAINGYATLEIARFAKRRQIPLIHISTDYVFDGKKGTPYVESDQVNPLSVYGKSKELGETLLLKEYPSGIIIRTSSLFGRAGASGKGGNFIETIIKRAKEKGEVTVVNDQFMSPTHSLDLAALLLKITESSRPLSGIFHFANSGPTTWYLFAKEILKLAKISVPIKPVGLEHFPSVVKRPINSSLDNSKIAKELGIHISTWEDALSVYFTRRKKDE